MGRLEYDWEDGVILQLVFNPASRDEQVGVSIVTVAGHGDFDGSEYHMEDFLPDLVVETNKTKTHLWNFDIVFVSVL